MASREGTEMRESRIREIDDSMREEYKKLMELISACISKLCHPIDLCALILISLAKIGPSQDDRENMAIGFAMANIALAGYSYPLIGRKMQDDETFQIDILECANLKENEEHVVFIDPVRRDLQEFVDDAKKSCQACGSIEESIKRCTNCKYVFYCGRQCQKHDWSSHKDFCKENAFSECE
jgi:radical SAM protein with 4Fe4S-binding SPASM domain